MIELRETDTFRDLDQRQRASLFTCFRNIITRQVRERKRTICRPLRPRLSVFFSSFFHNHFCDFTDLLFNVSYIRPAYHHSVSTGNILLDSHYKLQDKPVKEYSTNESRIFPSQGLLLLFGLSLRNKLTKKKKTRNYLVEFELLNKNLSYDWFNFDNYEKVLYFDIILMNFCSFWLSQPFFNTKCPSYAIIKNIHNSFLSFFNNEENGVQKPWLCCIFSDENFNSRGKYFNKKMRGPFFRLVRV